MHKDYHLYSGKTLTAIVTILLLAFIIPVLTVTADTPAEEAYSEQVYRRQMQAIDRYRRGISDINAWLSTRPDLYRRDSSGNGALPADADKQLMRDLWSRMLDYYLTLDSLAREHEDFYLDTDADSRRRRLLVYYNAWVAEYRGALDFLAMVEQYPAWDTVLNESIPALGMQHNSYQDFKYRFLHVSAGTRFMTLYSLYRFSYRDRDHLQQQQVISDSNRIIEYGKGEGELMTVRNAMTLLRQKHTETWLPVQKGVAEWMGDTRVLRPNSFLITPQQTRQLHKQLQPGDILLERREWYLSNAGLPGYWPHAALYIGTAAEREAYFRDTDIDTWLRAQGMPPGGDGAGFNRLLQRDFPEAWWLSQLKDKAGDPHRVLEAISEGVSFTSLEHSAAADSLVVLRPRLSKAEKARAIYRAFSHQGKPYDFSFDFVTDNELVCSELVYKAYEPGDGMQGLRLPVSTVLGRTVSTPNDIARLFDEEFGRAAQLEMVAFLDGDEKRRIAVDADVSTFRSSWQRPKWHILLPAETASGAAPVLAPGIQGAID